jgi:hypothetical protein
VSYDPYFPDDVSDLEEQASASGLALAPWVAAQAQPLREAHLAARLHEDEQLVKAKVAKWRRGACSPREGFHRIG